MCSYPPEKSGSARVFGYTVYRGFLNRVYGILQLKYGYSVYHFPPPPLADPEEWLVSENQLA